MQAKFRKMLRIILLLLIYPTAGWAIEENVTRFPPSSVLCIDEKSTGFNWRDRGWHQTNFIASNKYIIRKLDIDKYKDRTTEELLKNQTFFCENPSFRASAEKGKNFSGWVKSCYEIKDMGTPPSMVDAQMCTELWRDGRLQKISCQNHMPPLYFNPEGSFIRFPWHTEVDKSLDKKDSLAISVGSCSIIK
jgi:hypothetical protein